MTKGIDSAFKKVAAIDDNFTFSYSGIKQKKYSFVQFFCCKNSDSWKWYYWKRDSYLTLQRPMLQLNTNQSIYLQSKSVDRFHMMGNIVRLSINAYYTTSRSSRLQMFFKIGVLKIFAIVTGKHLCWSFFLIKLQAWEPATLSIGDSNTDVFP